MIVVERILHYTHMWTCQVRSGNEYIVKRNSKKIFYIYLSAHRVGIIVFALLRENTVLVEKNA